MTTASDQINASLRLIGQLAEGETPSSETSQDALDTLNQMLDSWSTEDLMIYSTQDQVFTWPSGSITRTLGATGNFVGNRPVLLDNSTYFVDTASGLSYGLKFINQEEYNLIVDKNLSSTYPEYIWVNNTFPDMTLTVYPEPSLNLEWHFISSVVLSQPATLDTVLSFPPGYLRAFKYNLALEIASEFGVDPLPQVQRIAMISKRDLKRINNNDDLLKLPNSIVTGQRRYNIFSGEY